MRTSRLWRTSLRASMKVPPKRKGNARVAEHQIHNTVSLNESPSEKEGKFVRVSTNDGVYVASMKVPPKRKGNVRGSAQPGVG